VVAGGQGPQDIGADTVRDADDLDRLRRRMANVIGHALRTPTATIRGQAEILARTGDEEERAQTIEVLRRSARRLEEMIDEVLVGEGIETRLPTGRTEDLVVAAELREVADGLEVVAEIEVVGDERAQVRAGRDALHWILRSLLDNAGRYGHRGVVRAEIEQLEDTTRVRVSSPHGDIGMTADDRRLSFEPFYRGERAVVVTATRLGLGLTIARRLATDLGGRVDLETDDERTIAVLELPRP
jgi:signal transduction histidine kinase